MALLIEKPAAAFELTQIGRGYLLWAKHFSWDEGKAGFVTTATENQIIVQYYPGIGNVTNHFIIPVSEAAKGQWEIRWSVDMVSVQEYNVKTDDKDQETEGDGADDIRGTDL